nr:SprB repeat-containing protein [Odoribacter sp.]
MKIRFRIIGLFVILLCIADVIFAQEEKYASGDYKCEIAIRAWDPNSHNPSCANYCHWWTKFEGEKDEVFRGECDLRGISESSNSWSNYTLTFTFPGDKKLEYIRFYTRRKRKKWTKCKVFGEGDFYCYFTNKTINPCSVFTFNNVWKAYVANATFTFTPVSVTLFNGEGKPTDGFLLDSLNITYKVNKNYSGGSFSWYYKKGASGLYKRFPEGNVSSSITFNGKTFKDEYVDAIETKKKFYIQARTGCGQTSNTITLDVPKEAPRLLPSSAQINHPVCVGDKNGSVKIGMASSLFPNETLHVALKEKDDKYYRKIILNKQESLIEFTGLPAGNYKLIFLSGTYLDVNRPTYVGNPDYHTYAFDLEDPLKITVEDLKATAVHCHGGKDGKISLKAGGGTGILYASLNNNLLTINKNNVSQITGVGAGEYRLSFRDEKGCVLKDEQGKEKIWSLKIEEPANVVAVQLKDNSLPSGYGQSDGMISVVASGGCGSGYLYHWEKDGQAMEGTDSFRDGLSAGKYSIFAVDGNYALASPPTEENIAGCRGFWNFVLGEPNRLTASVQLERRITCNGYHDGELRAVVNGGVKGYEYQWQIMQGNTWANVKERGADIEMTGGLKAGNYRVLVWDKNDNYAISEVFQLTEPAPYTIDFKMTQPLCHGGTDGKIEAVVSGNNSDYAYQWRGTPVVAPVISGSAGIYTLTVTDKRGCTVTEEADLREPSALQASFDIVKPSSAWASDGSIAIVPMGGTPYADGTYRYQWDYEHAVSNPLADIPADSVPYHVVVTDAHGCELELAPWLIYPLEVSVLLKDSISCFNHANGVLEAAACGGVGVNYRFEWYQVENEKLNYISTGIY